MLNRNFQRTIRKINRFTINIGSWVSIANGSREFLMKKSNPGVVKNWWENISTYLLLHCNRSFLREVDGLQNSQVTVVITSTASKNNEYLRSRIIPSIRTWMKDFINVFVIIEDTTEVRFNFRHCKFFDSQNFTSYNCPNEINYILTRTCTSEYYIGNGERTWKQYLGRSSTDISISCVFKGRGICCKNDDVINFLVEHPNLFAHSQFVIVADDDVYFRGDQMLRWLAAVARFDTTTPSSPLLPE